MTTTQDRPASDNGFRAHRNILIAVDNSDDSLKACQWAIENMYRQGDEFHLLHVIPAPTPEVVGGFAPGMGAADALLLTDPDPAVDKRNLEAAKKFIQEKFVPIVAQANIPYKVEIVRFNTDNDSIGEVLCARAVDLDATAVIMASHNKGRIKEFFLGSVTSYCTHHCKQPVLVLHAK
jgi:nucleotide-binding universal stress UspA family protein